MVRVLHGHAFDFKCLKGFVALLDVEQDISSLLHKGNDTLSLPIRDTADAASIVFCNADLIAPRALSNFVTH